MIYPTKKLREVCEVKKGKKPNLYTMQTKTRLPYLGAKFMRGTKEAEYAEKLDKNAVPVSKHDLIIICDGSKSGDIFSGFEGVLSSTMGRVDSDEGLIEKSYLEFFLRVNFDLFNFGKKGAAIPHLDFDILNNLEIPLPSLAEQKKIVAKLEKLLGKIKEAKQLRAESIEMTQKLFSVELQKIFEEGKKEFDLKDLGSVAILVRGPFGGSLKKEIFVNVGDCVYEQGNVIDNDLEDFRYFITASKFEEMKRFAVEAGDLLMSCSGTIGKFIIIPKIFKKGIINQALLKLTPNNKITVDYLKYALQDYLSLSSSHVKGMAIKNIASVKELKKFKIPLPPLVEQKKIVKRLDELSEKIRALGECQRAQQKDLSALEQSILSAAFSGKLM
jgi:type I restriction enzyme S subunit